MQTVEDFKSREWVHLQWFMLFIFSGFFALIYFTIDEEITFSAFSAIFTFFLFVVLGYNERLNLCLSREEETRTMTGIEHELKELILSQYKSIREFSNIIGIPYTTLDGILKRGIDKAGISNIIKICSHFKISTDKLAQGKIVPIDSVFTTTSLSLKEKALITKYRALDENGRELVESVLDTVYAQRTNSVADTSEKTTAS